MIREIRTIFNTVLERASIFHRGFGLNKLKKKSLLIMDERKSIDIPVVVILGETGVGKTKLAVELCRRFGGEVVSADSMQIYEGLDIITNKVTPDEADGIPHHLIGVVSPTSSSFNVQTFRNRASEIIDDMWRNRSKVPVIVGGTNYYIESLLWNRSVESETEIDEDGTEKDGDTFAKSIPFDVASMTDDQLHQELRRIDPTMADRKHPNNRRRVIRSIQIFYQTGRPHSEWLNDQHSTNGGNVLGGPLRISRLCVLWLTCDDRSILKDRLRRRVDDMVTKGLKEEITTFYDRHYESFVGRHGDDLMTKGILQSIGLKEFEKYLALSIDQRSSDDIGKSAFDEGVEKLKSVTIHYAAKQKKWIKNRFCRLAARDSIPIYILDATDVEKWTNNVSNIAEHVVDSFLNNRRPAIELKTASAVESDRSDFAAENRYCETCQRLIDGLQWDGHVKSKKHKLQFYKKVNFNDAVKAYELKKKEAAREADSESEEREEKISRSVS